MDEERAPQEGGLVSMVLPVYNDRKTVGEALQTLLGQAYGNTELIVVDDGSTDGSLDVVRSLTGGRQSVTLVAVPHGGTSRAKNEGFRHSNGNLVLFAEADAIYDSKYVEEALRAIKEGGPLGGVCMMMGVKKANDSLTTNCIVAEYSIKHRMARQGRIEPYFAWFLKREAFEKAGAFDPSLSQAEDKDLFARVQANGFQIAMVTDVLWWHRIDQSFVRFVLDSYRRGRNRVPYLLKNGRLWELFKGVVPVSVIIALALASPLSFFALAVLLLFVAGATVAKMLTTIPYGWNCGSLRRYVMLLPFIQIARYFFTGLGYTVGLLRRPNSASDSAK